MTHNAVRSPIHPPSDTQRPAPVPRRRRVGPLALAAALAVGMAGAGGLTAQAAPGSGGGKSVAAATAATTAVQLSDAGAPLTNLAHLDFLLDTVPLTEVPGHTTYQLAEDPDVLAPWTYADNTDGVYTRVGGGDLDPATGNWTQGAFNADDTSRAAVVYLRHWQQTGSAESREKAFQTLRSLTYLQTDSGPNAGNVVLWQQADGSLTPSATPIELPDPSDSAESYWVARTVWALGEGYAAFQHEDPAFAEFLQERLHLSLDSLNKQSLARYGQYDVADGTQVPAWLIAGGADASAEAVLGLAAYAEAAPGDDLARTALTQLAEGVAGMSSGSASEWPFGAILPWNKSQSFWHAWGGLAPAAVADASVALDRDDLLEAAVLDSAVFTPQLLAAGGPDNAWSPTPGEAQIAYGVDSRLQGLVQTAEAADAPGLLDLAAITAGWYFGANRSGAPAYNPATGTAVDGIEMDGRVNLNSGAESTIHALFSMLVLDANPELKAAALGIDKTVSTSGLSVVEAESGVISGTGMNVMPESAWTGEGNWSGGSYVSLNAGDTLTLTVPAGEGARNVYPIVNQTEAASGGSKWTSGRQKLGTTLNGDAGAQGITDAPGKLSPLSLDRALPGRATTVTGKTDAAASVDALLLQPQISTVAVSGSAGDSTLYVSSTTETHKEKVDVPRGYVLSQRGYDATGQAIDRPGKKGHDRSGTVTIAPGGFTVVTLTRR